MYVLRGISPRMLSIFRNNDTGKVIPSFSVLSAFFFVILTILVDYIQQPLTIRVFLQFQIANEEEKVRKRTRGPYRKSSGSINRAHD
jgi:hypothetical protein